MTGNDANSLNFLDEYFSLEKNPETKTQRGTEWIVLSIGFGYNFHHLRHGFVDLGDAAGLLSGGFGDA